MWRAGQPPLMLCLQTMQLAMQLPPPPARLPLFSYCSWSPSPSIRLQTNKQNKRNFILVTSSTISVYSHLVSLLLDNFVSQKIIKILREGFKKSKWKFKMAFAIRGPTPPPLMAKFPDIFLPHSRSFAIESYLYETDFTLKKYHF